MIVSCLLISFLFAGTLIVLKSVSQVVEKKWLSKVTGYTLYKNEAATEDATVFLVGGNIDSVYGLDLANQTFCATGYFWLKWTDMPKEMEDWDKEIYKEPVRTLSFSNSIDPFYKEITPSKPYKDVDGRYIQWVEFDGKFRSSGISLKDYPFEKIKLSVNVEVEDFWINEFNIDFQADKHGELITGSPELNGYNFTACYFDQYVKRYYTNWGQKGAINFFKKDNYTEYYAVKLDLFYRRSRLSSLFNIFLPLIIVMGVVLATPLVSVEHYEAKLILPASVLLVLVFLQEGYKRVLPDGLNYLTFADLVYSYSYLTTIIIFCWTLVQTNEYLLLESNSAIEFAEGLNGQNKYIFITTLIWFLVGPFILSFNSKVLAFCLTNLLVGFMAIARAVVRLFGKSLDKVRSFYNRR